MSETDLHLAELRKHARAAGIERFRLLRRDELIESLRSHGVDLPEATAEPKDQRGPGRGRRRRGDRSAPSETEEAPTRPAQGVLDITPRGHGFLRGSELQASDDDVYVSASQIRRCVLRAGDTVSGPAREPRRDERYPALVHVDQVNQAEPVEDRPSFDEFVAARPARRLEPDLGVLDSEAEELLAGQPALTGIQAGQRVLVRAQVGSLRFELLRAMAKALAAKLGPDVIVLLIDVPPEELAAWSEDGGDAKVAALAADSSPAAAGRVARLALEHAKRRAESGADAVLIVDSLSRLAVFEEDITGVKRLFGAGRDLEGEGGSLTVVATTLDDDDAYRAVATTESASVTLAANAE